MPTFSMRLTDLEYAGIEAGAYMESTTMAGFVRETVFTDLAQTALNAPELAEQRLAEYQAKLQAAVGTLQDFAATRQTDS